MRAGALRFSLPLAGMAVSFEMASRAFATRIIWLTVPDAHNERPVVPMVARLPDSSLVSGQ
jgi:hypothetical protein